LTHRPGKVLRPLLRAPAVIYDWRLGWLLGHRFIRLSHTGRRSGRTYQTVLEVLHIDQATEEIVVVAGLGRTTDWLRNLEAGGPSEVALATRRFPAQHRILNTAEAIAVLADYERRNRLIMPVIRRMLTWLTGWHYDSSPEARQHVVQQLPMIGLQPTKTGT
jgi:deazaflavin-dependent oxidoreductase (nitroreductase family)